MKQHNFTIKLYNFSSKQLNLSKNVMFSVSVSVTEKFSRFLELSSLHVG